MIGHQSHCLTTMWSDYVKKMSRVEFSGKVCSVLSFHIDFTVIHMGLDNIIYVQSWLILNQISWLVVNLIIYKILCGYIFFGIFLSLIYIDLDNGIYGQSCLVLKGGVWFTYLYIFDNP